MDRPSTFEIQWCFIIELYFHRILLIKIIECDVHMHQLSYLGELSS